MKLDDILQSNDKIESLREQHKRKVNELDDLKKIFEEKREEKLNNYEIQCAREFIDFFQSSDFNVDSTNSSKVIARKCGTNITIMMKDCHDFGFVYNMTIEPSNEKYKFGFEICNQQKKINPYTYNYDKNNIPNCNKEEEVLEKIKLIDDEINFYRNSITQIDDAKFVYKYNEDDEYETFEKLFEAI